MEKPKAIVGATANILPDTNMRPLHIRQAPVIGMYANRGTRGMSLPTEYNRERERRRLRTIAEARTAIETVPHAGSVAIEAVMRDWAEDSVVIDLTSIETSMTLDRTSVEALALLIDLDKTALVTA